MTTKPTRHDEAWSVRTTNQNTELITAQGETVHQNTHIASSQSNCTTSLRWYYSPEAVDQSEDTQMLKTNKSVTPSHLKPMTATDTNETTQLNNQKYRDFRRKAQTITCEWLNVVEGESLRKKYFINDHPWVTINKLLVIITRWVTMHIRWPFFLFFGVLCVFLFACLCVWGHFLR